LERFANGERRSAPPVARILFRPTGLRTGKVGVFFRARSENGAVLIENYGAGSAGSDIDAEDWNTASI
jgi:hypothetical protein